MEGAGGRQERQELKEEKNRGLFFSLKLCFNEHHTKEETMGLPHDRTRTKSQSFA